MPSVVFVCVANSFRSQMAEAIAKQRGSSQWEIWSAGSHPSGRVHPMAVHMMEELGLEMAKHRSKGLAELPAKLWDYVVTMGCEDRCPMLDAKHKLAWDIPDPAGLPVEEVRRIREQIAGLVGELLSQAGVQRS